MRTEIATLGEFGLIRHLTEGIELKNESSRYGVGDDAAVLSYPAEKEVLVTTDLLMKVSISTLCMCRSSIWGINRP